MTEPTKMIGKVGDLSRCGRRFGPKRLWTCVLGRGHVGRHDPIGPPTLEALRSAVGDKAYRYLRRGGLLQIWRQSSPHNWFIENPRKPGEYYWHSAPGHPHPNLRAFELADDSHQRVPIYWGSDSGRPSLSRYRLKRPWPYP